MICSLKIQMRIIDNGNPHRLVCVRTEEEKNKDSSRTIEIEQNKRVFHSCEK